MPSACPDEQSPTIAMPLGSILEPIADELEKTQNLYQETVLKTAERDYIQRLLTGEAGEYIPEQFREKIADKIAHHLLQGEGKWIRASLTLLTADACGIRGERAHQIAVAVELIHLATLVHDDIIDEAPVRRGLPSVAGSWGNRIAVLLGDFLYCKAFGLLLSSQCVPVQHLLTNAAGQMCLGEIKQLRFSHGNGICESDYMEMIEYKTASLMAGAAASGGYLAGLDEQHIEHLHGYGHGLGMAFQITDDVLDYTSSSNTLGKEQGGDLRNGKVTLPLIHVMENDRETAQQILENEEEVQNKTQTLLSLMKSNGSLAYSERVSKQYGAMAKNHLQQIEQITGPSESLNSLYSLVDFVLTRDR